MVRQRRKEAALFYISIFEQSKLLDSTIIEGTPSGDADGELSAGGQQFMQSVQARILN